MLITTGYCGGQKHKQVGKHEASSQGTERGQENEGLGVTSGSLELPDAGRVQKDTQSAAHHQRWHPGMEGAWIESIPVFSQLWHAQLAKTAVHFLPSKTEREG